MQSHVVISVSAYCVDKQFLQLGCDVVWSGRNVATTWNSVFQTVVRVPLVVREEI